MIGINYQQMLSIAARLTLSKARWIITLGIMGDFNKLSFSPS